MKHLVVPVVLSVCAVLAKADTIVIPFSGSGASGTIAPGLAWAINTSSTDSFGSPGVSQGVLAWPGSPTPQDITDFTVTFSGLPTGVTIDPTSLATAAQDCAGNASGGTVFCSTVSGSYVQWTPTLSNGNDTITFEAPTGDSLNSGNDYFVNIFFNGNEGASVAFTGGWSSTSTVPEPGSLLLTVAGLGALGLGRRAVRCLRS